MIISSHHIQTVLRLYGAQKLQAAEDQHNDKAKQKELQKGDKAELSLEALDHQKLCEAVLQTPEVREDRVQEIKDALEKGEYDVSADKVAEKMLGQFLVDRLV
ncbi:MAG: flagellar biosynthesis anti-sigma factor FlgM [Syntrophaceticus sp.]